MDFSFRSADTFEFILGFGQLTLIGSSVFGCVITSCALTLADTFFKSSGFFGKFPLSLSKANNFFPIAFSHVTS